MTVFGLTPQGFNPKPQAQILADMEAAERAGMDPALDVSADQAIGQLNGIISQAHSKLWELIAAVYKSFHRDAAEGDALEALAKLTGTAKAGARFATCKCTIVTTQGIDLTPGTHFAQLDSDATVRFTPVLPFHETAAGAYTNVSFQAEVAGPVLAATGHLDVISTPVVGWASVINTTDATGGLPADNDDALRTKMAEDTARTGSANVDSIRADVLALSQGTAPKVPQLESVTVFENVGDTIDGNGLPPHSFMVLVFDGDTPDAGNANFIAQAIWDSKPAGIQAYGALSGTALDKLGASKTVAFSRVTPVPIYLTYQLVTNALYGGNTVFELAIATIGNSGAALAGAGADVIWAQALAAAFLIPGVVDVTSLKIGTSASPTGVVNIPIDAMSLARFDSSRVLNV